ncbi:hypothetical protein NUU61_004036 [Penicillium alfredii]|uniref:SRP9 domain-containing protein n=1 Tax=Penicillium alfredii TaxID=1506179 RepID=A0A9W9FKC4_9EURO|nr:uncharacterized protein NUU61_004036 [Penicillium alfredii]KAJ5101814.1 hypothetical protein NUU61_004036 [Penicillium alfredii]
MPYLPTSQAFLEQSALLLEAYPETTRITTKYSFPHQKKPQPSSTTNTSNTADATSTTPAPTTAPVAALTLKTFNPTAGICLKYRTNKGAEVGRLITGLGKLAGGADVASLGVAATGGTGGGMGDVEMVDAPAEDGAAAAAGAGAGAGAPGGSGKNAGGKGKKKGGKGKR